MINLPFPGTSEPQVTTQSSIDLHNLLSDGVENINKKIDLTLAQYNLTRGRLRVLQMCANETIGCLPTDIAREMEVTPATVSGILKALQEKGYIQILSNANDGRNRRVGITAVGEQIKRSALAKWESVIAALWKEFETTEIAQIRASMEKLCAFDVR